MQSFYSVSYTHLLGSRGGGALPAFITQLTGKEGEKPRFALILFILYL